MTAVAEAPETKKATAPAKLEVSLRSLQKALATVARAVERRTTIPILSSVRIEQREQVLELAGTNLDLSIVVTVATPNAKSSSPFLLPALKTHEYAKLLTGDVVSLEVKDERATLRCGRSTTKLPSLPLSNFPRIPDAPRQQALAIGQDMLERLVHFVGFAVSEEESRFSIRGALLEVANGRLMLVATDGYRLARYTVATEADPVNVLLPADLLKTLEWAVDGEGTTPVLLEVTEQNIFAVTEDASGSVEIAGRRLAAQFPNYKAVLPTKMIAAFTVDAASMAVAVKRCLSFADTGTGTVALTISSESVGLRAASVESGETEEVVDVVSVSAGDTFAAFKIGFQGEYLLDAFSRLSGNVQMRFSVLDGSNAMMIVAEPKDGELFEYVVMPLRLA